MSQHKENRATLKQLHHHPTKMTTKLIEICCWRWNGRTRLPRKRTQGWARTKCWWCSQFCERKRYIKMYLHAQRDTKYKTNTNRASQNRDVLVRRIHWALQDELLCQSSLRAVECVSSLLSLSTHTLTIAPSVVTQHRWFALHKGRMAYSITLAHFDAFKVYMFCFSEKN